MNTSIFPRARWVVCPLVRSLAAAGTRGDIQAQPVRDSPGPVQVWVYRRVQASGYYFSEFQPPRAHLVTYIAEAICMQSGIVLFFF